MTNQVVGSQFIKDSMTAYGVYICANRAVPNFYDGMKPSIRRIAYTYWKHFMGTDVKVATLAGRTMAIHPHGDAALSGAISRMARQWAGANNHAIFINDGSVGSRVEPEIECIAAPRYLGVKGSKFLSDVVLDSSEVYDYVPTYDAKDIEVSRFTPAIPLSLINGDAGIALGYSVNILPRSVGSLSRMINSILDGGEPVDEGPGWNGFTGEVVKLDACKWESRSVVVEEQLPRKKVQHVIVDLPTNISYEFIIDSLERTGVDFSDETTDVYRIVCRLEKGQKVPAFRKSHAESIRFIRDGKMVSYQSVTEYLKEFVVWRLTVYERVRQYHISKLNAKAKDILGVVMSIRSKFNTLVDNTMTRQDMVDLAVKMNLPVSVVDMKVYEFSAENEKRLISEGAEVIADLKVWNQKTAVGMYKEKLSQISAKYW
jgi:DNA gyrase/topoisomerase IV subunit A